MIFKQITEILNGAKTQTRRVRKDTEGAAATSPFNGSYTRVYLVGKRSVNKWQVYNEYAIVPKRGAAGIGRKIRLTAIRCEHLHDITEQDARAEGVASVAEYKALWESINGKSKATRWDANPEVWVLEFELVKE